MMPHHTPPTLAGFNFARKHRLIFGSLLCAGAVTSAGAANVTWDGEINTDTAIGLNWDNDSGPVAGDHIYINSGTVEHSNTDLPNLRSVRQSGGSMTASGGYLQASFNSSQHCLVNGNFTHTGGTVDLNELEIGSHSGDTGFYLLDGGDLIIARGLSDFSLYLGGNHDSNTGGDGSLQIVSGSMVTRTGVKLGHATQAGTGLFEVQGSSATQIGIGTQGSVDGWWEQNAGSTLKVRVDASGLTPIFIDDVEGTNGTYATFESGSLLDVNFYNHLTSGTWTVMEVENGDITDNGLAFAPSVDTGIWSFNIDNSGVNGLLTVTATATAQTAGNVTWDGSESSEWENGLNWDNSYGPITSGDTAIIHSGTVAYSADSGPSLRELILNGGVMTINEGSDFDAGSFGTSIVDATLTQLGDAGYNKLRIGNTASKNGTYYLQSGDMVIGRGDSATPNISLYLAHNASSTGTFEISGGSFKTRTGLRMHTSGATFSVLGSAATEIGIGSHSSIDGTWYQAAGATLQVGIDSAGVTKVFIDDTGGTGTSATFESGALLDVSYYTGGRAGGTWTVMEVENGDIIDNGLALAPGVDGIWSFAIDNSGANGILTVTSTASSTAENVTWTGNDSSDWENPLNWDNNTGPTIKGDTVYINSGSVIYDEESTPNLNAIHQTTGNFLITGGSLSATNNSSRISTLNGIIYHTGGSAQFNRLEIGSDSGANAFYHLQGGDLAISRGYTGISLHIGSNSGSSSDAGNGTLEISSGSLTSRVGVRLGDATHAGTGTFSVLGAGASEIGIGSSSSGDGVWHQHPGSTLKVGIDSLGVTKIFIDDVEGTNSTYALFDSGALLDVDYYNAGSGGGTWVIMEVENGNIIDNGLAFAPGVDTGIWSFGIDNSGSNGILYVTASGTFAGESITVGNTPQQKMRYGMDYERLWYWTSSLNNSERDDVARWSAVDADIDFVRVAMNSGYELTENTFVLSAYTNKIIPLMQEMQQANPNIKFFASPRPLNEAVSGASWQPYPLWVTDPGETSYTDTSYNFNDIKCAEYIVKYLLLMKSYGFKISFLDVTNEWQSNVGGGRLTQDDMDNIHEYLNVTYMANPWPHPALSPTLLLTAEDIPEIIAPSSWSLEQGTTWISNLDTGDKEAISIAASHNTDRAGSAQLFADAAKAALGDDVEIWNTETHGWKSTSGANETTSFYYYLEAIRAGFGGINGWLAIGTTGQGHSYILNPSGTPTRNVKYYIFRKLSSTSNYGHALNIIEEPGLDIFNAPLGSNDDDIPRNVAAFIKGNLMTVWVVNENAESVPLEITPSGYTIATSTVRQTRWTDPSDVEGFESVIPITSNTEFQTVIPGESVVCFEITLNTETFAQQRYEAEDYSHHWGTNTEDHTSYFNLGNINGGDWIRFGSVALEEDSTLTFSVARPSGRPNGLIRVREGNSEGSILGEVSIPETGGWQTYQTIATQLDTPAGIYNLYLEFVEDGGSTGNAFVNIDWFEVQAQLSEADYWRLENFGIISESGVAADSANTDGDSIVNLLEFAFGTDPNVNDASAMTVDGSSFTPGTPIVDVSFSPLSVKARFVRLVDHASASISYTAQFSHDLSSWEDLDGSSAVRINSTFESNGYEAVELDYPLFLSNGRKAQFYRIQINDTESENTQP